MANVVWKYQQHITKKKNLMEFLAPVGYEIIHIGLEGATLKVWMVIDDASSGYVEAAVAGYRTGQEMSDFDGKYPSHWYLQTVTDSDEDCDQDKLHVFHLFKKDKSEADC